MKIVKEEVAEGRGLTLQQIMLYDAHAHLRQEPYGWCWAAAAFLDQHPQTQAAFRELKSRVSDRTLDFSQQFAERLEAQWPAISQDWALFVRECDYGYDFARAAAVHRPPAPLPAGGATVTLDAARGWQSSGIAVQAGKTYSISASGRFEVAQQPRPWPCEAGGVTIRYVGGKPLGMLVAAVSDVEGEQPTVTPLASPQPIGAAGELTPAAIGTLYLKINEHPSGLADNSGTLGVAIRPK